jgi:hypothetical protein
VYSTDEGYWTYDLGVGSWAGDDGFRVLIEHRWAFLRQRDAFRAACRALRTYR